MSTVPAVKAALVALIAGTLPNTQVIYGSPANKTARAHNMITVETVTGSTDRSSMDPSGGYTENYQVQMVTSVTLNGPDQERVAAEMALSNFGAVVSAIAGNPTLGIANVSATPNSAFELQEFPSDNGRNAVVIFAVSVFAVVV